MARVLFLRHHLEDRPGLIGDAFIEHGYDVELVMMDENAVTPSLDGYDVMVILGSKCAVYDQEIQATWFHNELELIERADVDGIPILGICFGAQALCRHFGGEVTRAPNGEIGWYDIDVVEGVALGRGPWFEFHFDRCELPERARLWASSERAVQAFSIGRHVGVQFHPEIDEHQLKDWLDSDEEDARDLGLDLDALIEETARETPAARERAGQLVDLFLRHAEV